VPKRCQPIRNRDLERRRLGLDWGRITEAAVRCAL